MTGYSSFCWILRLESDNYFVFEVAQSGERHCLLTFRAEIGKTFSPIITDWRKPKFGEINFEKSFGGICRRLITTTFLKCQFSGAESKQRFAALIAVFSSRHLRPKFCPMYGWILVQQLVICSLVARYFISLWAVNINQTNLHDLQTGFIHTLLQTGD